MPRFHGDLVPRVDRFCDRVLDVAEELDHQKRFRRIVDQMSGSGPSVGANVAEADEAMSARDFTKSIRTALKELSETQFWLRMVVRRKWITERRLSSLLAEAVEIRKILGKIASSTKA